MDFDERFLWFFIGGIIGGILGYVVSAIQLKNKNSKGIVPMAALVITVLLTVYAGFASQAASNKVEKISSCNRTYLAQTIDALNERTSFNRARADLNLKVQQQQEAYISTRAKYGPSSEESQMAIERYARDLDGYLAAVQKITEPDVQYPTPNQLLSCSKGAG